MNIGVLYLNSMDGRKNNSKLSMTRELKKLGVKVIGAREYEIPYLKEGESDNISFSDVNSFKGLEKEAVILCNFKEINESTVKEIYTGLSRATGDLTVITYKEAINQIRKLNMKLIYYLSKIDINSLLKFLNKRTVEILKHFGYLEKITSPKISKIIVKSYSEQKILSTKKIRNCLFDTFTKNEIESLSKIISRSEKKNYYTFLKFNI